MIFLLTTYLNFKNIIMHLNKADIEKAERIWRLNLINSITGIKPANLIGTISDDGETNLAIFSSVVHLGSNPALIGFMLRPHGEVRRHTYENIMENGVYTINHIHQAFIEQAHYTSAKFTKEESEFDYCGFTEAYLPDLKAPFVKESKLKLGMKFLEGIPIRANDTMMMVGSIEHIIVPDEVVDEKGHVDLAQLDDVGIAGLNSYYSLQKLNQFPYARKSELPTFRK